MLGRFEIGAKLELDCGTDRVFGATAELVKYYWTIFGIIFNCGLGRSGERGTIGGLGVPSALGIIGRLIRKILE
jgi:hypothetical protein